MDIIEVIKAYEILKSYGLDARLLFNNGSKFNGNDLDSRGGVNLEDKIPSDKGPNLLNGDI